MIACEECGELNDVADAWCSSCGASTGRASVDGPARREPAARESRPRKAHGGAAQRARHARLGRQVQSAGRWILVLAVVFFVSGSIVGYQTHRGAEEVRVALNTLDFDESYELETGEVFTVSEVHQQINREVLLAFGISYLLAFIMLGLFFWSKSSPMPAILTALGVYLVVLTLNAIVDPTSIFRGVILKVFILTGIGVGIRAAMDQRAMQSEA